jgi:hypothetical protein
MKKFFCSIIAQFLKLFMRMSIFLTFTATCVSAVFALQLNTIPSTLLTPRKSVKPTSAIYRPSRPRPTDVDPVTTPQNMVTAAEPKAPLPITDMPTKLQLQFSIVMDNCITRMKVVAGVAVKDVIEHWGRFKRNEPVVKAAVRCLADWSHLLKMQTGPYLVLSASNNLKSSNPNVGKFRAADVSNIYNVLESCLNLDRDTKPVETKKCSDDDATALLKLKGKVFFASVNNNESIPFLVVPVSTGIYTSKVVALPTTAEEPAVVVPANIVRACRLVVEFADKGPANVPNSSTILQNCITLWVNFLVSIARVNSRDGVKIIIIIIIY